MPRFIDVTDTSLAKAKLKSILTLDTMPSIVADGVTDDGPAIQACYDAGEQKFYIPAGKTVYIDTAVFFDNDELNEVVEFIGMGPGATLLLGPNLPTTNGFLTDLDAGWAFFPNTDRAALSAGVVNTGSSLLSATNAAKSATGNTRVYPGIVFRGVTIKGNYQNVGVAFCQGDTACFENCSLLGVRWGASGKLYNDGLFRFSNVNAFWNPNTTVPGVRTDSCTTTSGSSTVSDTSITANDAGKPVSGAGIPPNAVIGSVSPGSSFTIRSMTADAITATASATVNLTIGLPYACLGVQQTFADGVVFDQVKCSGPIKHWWAIHCHSGSMRDCVGGGADFADCFGITISSTRQELQQAITTNAPTPVFTLDRSAVTAIGYNCYRGEGDAYPFEIRDLTGLPKAGSNLVLVNPKPGLALFKNTVDAASAPDIYISSANKPTRVQVIGNAAAAYRSGGTTFGPDAIIIDSADSDVLDATQQSVYGTPLGALAMDFTLKYQNGSWMVGRGDGSFVQKMQRQAAPSITDIDNGFFVGTLDGAQQYAYACAVIADDGLFSDATSESTFTTPTAGSTTIAASSNGASVGSSTIYVADTSSFDSTGRLQIGTDGLGDSENTIVRYTGKTATSFTGCTLSGGPAITLATGMAVGVPGSLRIEVTVTAPGDGLMVWRKAGTGVLSAPDAYCVIPMAATTTDLYDTGDHLSGRPWVTSSVPVPNTVADGAAASAREARQIGLAAPTIAAQSAAGAGATATISGNNTCGTITVTTGSSAVAAGTQAIVTFGSSPLAETPTAVILTAGSGFSAGKVPFCSLSGLSSTSFSVNFNNTPATGQEYTFYYRVI